MLSNKKAQKEWRTMSAAWGGNDKAIARYYEELNERYSAQNRYYHSLNHIHAMLELARVHKPDMHDCPSLYFAIWFHDAVQGIAIDGEAQSAALCEQYLIAINTPDKIISKSKQMILATKTHQRTDHSEVDFFLDLDLAILGANWSSYENYSRETRLEYSLPDWMYRRGRKKFLQNKLNQKRIFITPAFVKKYESSARQNMHREMVQLGGRL